MRMMMRLNGMTLTISKEGKIRGWDEFLALLVLPFHRIVWDCLGIMNSFTSIAGSKNTSLAVVAPGIAEALFATALGLAAAIPAVIAYNKFSGDLDKLGGSLDVFARIFYPFR